jgi:hypothetical protein
VDIERAYEFVMPSASGRAGQGGRVTEVDLFIEQRTLEFGRPVIAWPSPDAVYMAYDPVQIGESQAVTALTLLMPDAPAAFRVTRSGDCRQESHPRILQSMAPRAVQERAG